MSILRKKRGPPSPETRLKISLAQRGKPRPNVITSEQRRKLSEANRGSKSHLWRGGISHRTRTDRANVMASVEYRIWRTSVFQRDNYTCIFCGATSGNGKAVYLCADHIKPYALFPEHRLDISNGRTLCLACHRKTDTFGSKVHNYDASST